VYLIDTNVISEARKRERANPGVLAFLRMVAERDEAMYLSVVTVGELRRGVDLIRHRGDGPQAMLLERWIRSVLRQYEDQILPFEAEAAQVWGRLRVPHPEHELDKQIAATALVHDLTVVTRNVQHFVATGVKLLNPFSAV
jgi:predicted nucleic acid-binding protein